jgi:Transporter associated domain
VTSATSPAERRGLVGLSYFRGRYARTFGPGRTASQFGARDSREAAGEVSISRIEAPDTDAESVGGLVLDVLGRLAKPGDSVTINGHRLTVIRADPTRIRKIRLEPYNPETAATAVRDAEQQAG